MVFYADLRRKGLKLLEVPSEESRLAGPLYIEDGEVNPVDPGVATLSSGPLSGMGEIRREVVPNGHSVVEQRSSGAAHARSTTMEGPTSAATTSDYNQESRITTRRVGLQPGHLKTLDYNQRSV